MAQDSADLVKAFLANGGKVTRLAITDSSGITCKEWERLVRADTSPVETDPRGTPEWEREMGFQQEARIRAGHGAVS